MIFHCIFCIDLWLLCVIWKCWTRTWRKDFCKWHEKETFLLQTCQKPVSSIDSCAQIHCIALLPNSSVMKEISFVSNIEFDYQNFRNFWPQSYLVGAVLIIVLLFSMLWLRWWRLPCYDLMLWIHTLLACGLGVNDFGLIFTAT